MKIESFRSVGEKLQLNVVKGAASAAVTGGATEAAVGMAAAVTSSTAAISAAGAGFGVQTATRQKGGLTCEKSVLAGRR
jgi:hypothetical protein